MLSTNGALGSRGMHKLQNFGRDKPLWSESDEEDSYLNLALGELHEAMELIEHYRAICNIGLPLTRCCVVAQTRPQSPPS